MSKMLKIAVVALVLATGLGLTPAQAGPINGAITISDTLNPPGFLPCSGASVVGDCTRIAHLGNGNAGGGTLDFSAFAGPGCAACAIMKDWVFATPLALLNEIIIPGFSFDIRVAIVFPKSPLICGATSCADALTIFVSGIVTGAGFDPTAFTGTLAMTGSCVGTATGCTGPYSGGYTYSLAAAGQVVRLPEPTTLL